MVDLRHHQGEAIKVQQLFETSRLERVFLMLAYERIVPIRRCPARSRGRSQKSVPSEEIAFFQPTAGVGA